MQTKTMKYTGFWIRWKSEDLSRENLAACIDYLKTCSFVKNEEDHDEEHHDAQPGSSDSDDKLPDEPDSPFAPSDFLRN